MKRGFILTCFVLAFSLFFAMPAKAAGEASFSISSQRTSYAVGDEIPVSFSVDAGDFASTLSVIDMTVRISDSTILSASDLVYPFTTGQIYSQVNLQEVNNDTIHVVVNVDPANKPVERSGVIGTITFTALKAGQVTISYDVIMATEENKETEYISTTASSLDLTIADASAAGSGASVTATATARAANSAAVTTGPREAILIALFGGFAIFLILRISRKARRT